MQGADYAGPLNVHSNISTCTCSCAKRRRTFPSLSWSLLNSSHRFPVFNPKHSFFRPRKRRTSSEKVEPIAGVVSRSSALLSFIFHFGHGRKRVPLLTGIATAPTPRYAHCRRNTSVRSVLAIVPSEINSYYLLLESLVCSVLFFGS